MAHVHAAARDRYVLVEGGLAYAKNATRRRSHCRDRFDFPGGPWPAIAKATEESSARWLVARPLRHGSDRPGSRFDARRRLSAHRPALCLCAEWVIHLSQVDAHALSRPEAWSETDHEPTVARARRRGARSQAHAPNRPVRRAHPELDGQPTAPKAGSCSIVTSQYAA